MGREGQHQCAALTPTLQPTATGNTTADGALNANTARMPICATALTARVVATRRHLRKPTGKQHHHGDALHAVSYAPASMARWFASNRPRR
jgi:hypothetical protein